MVEFSDFECPVCEEPSTTCFRASWSTYPQVRLVFKDFPLEQHPWARSAAVAGRCAYNQEPKAFWKLYDLIYDNQDIISPENSYAKLTDYASQLSLNPDTFKSCLVSPEAAAAVEASQANGLALQVSSTPTIFINGRRIVGADPHVVEQNIKYELEQQKTARLLSTVGRPNRLIVVRGRCDPAREKEASTAPGIRRGRVQRSS